VRDEQSWIATLQDAAIAPDDARFDHEDSLSLSPLQSLPFVPELCQSANGWQKFRDAPGVVPRDCIMRC
jgi:hypothetical protein